MLNDLLGKAQSELDDTRHAVSNAPHNFAMLEQSHEDRLATRFWRRQKRTRQQQRKPISRRRREFGLLVTGRKQEQCSYGFGSRASVESFANELKALADATQVLRVRRRVEPKGRRIHCSRRVQWLVFTPRAISRGLKLWPW